MVRFLLFLITLHFVFENPKLVEACFATQSPSIPVVTTEVPPELRTCSASEITYGVADPTNPEGPVSVTYFGLTSTQIAGTLDSISTMKISCMAIDGYYVNMEFQENGQVKENLENLRNITVEVTCDSRTMEWIYSSVLDNGDVYTHTVSSVVCPQASLTPLNACSPTTIMYAAVENPQVNVEVTNFGFTSTRVPDTTETISTMKISCMAIDGYYVHMYFNGGGQVKENLDNIQNITVEVTCDSRDGNWIYSTVLDNGSPYTRMVTNVNCLQVQETPLNACSPTTIMYGEGDNESPQLNVDVTNFGFTSTQIPGTLDTISTTKISCMAIDEYYVNMEFNGNEHAKENLDNVQNITVEVTCDSRVGDWKYITELPGGVVYDPTVTAVECLQLPL
ncbi:hypothetical protein L5515_007521 [Caenorhabditis briggsae]|uniref:C6 domain-containing protein n=1 Tax=Caenorhabditis briggsae TaxID=6238 RepID=A0AAE9F246_CAEBR|nr:hypothetical protein L5515_007521 [Caenorhabditis briggsae]